MRFTSKASDPIFLTEVPAFRDAIVKRSIKDVIADKIADLIASGILRVGDALPSETTLSSPSWTHRLRRSGPRGTTPYAF